MVTNKMMDDSLDWRYCILSKTRDSQQALTELFATHGRASLLQMAHYIRIAINNHLYDTAALLWAQAVKVYNYDARQLLQRIKTYPGPMFYPVAIDKAAQLEQSIFA